MLKYVAVVAGFDIRHGKAGCNHIFDLAALNITTCITSVINTSITAVIILMNTTILPLLFIFSSCLCFLRIYFLRIPVNGCPDCLDQCRNLFFENENHRNQYDDDQYNLDDSHSVLLLHKPFPYTHTFHIPSILYNPAQAGYTIITITRTNSRIMGNNSFVDASSPFFFASSRRFSNACCISCSIRFLRSFVPIRIY